MYTNTYPHNGGPWLAADQPNQATPALLLSTPTRRITFMNRMAALIGGDQ